MTGQLSGLGLDKVPLRIPDQWSPAWFARFVREVLALADARNAIPGAGIDIEGDPSSPATISAGGELEELLNASVITVTATDLDSARQLVGEDGVVSILDNGAGDTVEVGLELNGVTLAKLAQQPELSVLGTQLGGTVNIDPVSALANGQILRRANDALSFGLVPDDALPAPQYLPQTEQSIFYMADDFVKGHNIVGVRYSGEAFVYIPNDLPSERIVVVKDEAGTGDVSVRPYSANLFVSAAVFGVSIQAHAAVVTAP